MKNQEIAKILYEMAELLEIENVAFKPRAYEKAAQSIETFERDIEEIYKRGGIKELEKIPGVGKGIAERIEEFFKTGKIRDYEKLRKKMPADIGELILIEGVGPKIIKELYEKLKIKNIKELEKAARTGKLRNLPRFGEKLEQKILKGIKFQKKTKGRIPIGEALLLAEDMVGRIKKIPETSKAEIAGSLRRRKETIGDIDILVVSKKPEKVMDFFVKLPEVSHIYAKGPTKTLVRLNIGIDADLRVIPAESFGAALQYFTGNKDHNVELRKMAAKKNRKLNEYGLYETKDKKEIKIAGETEEEIYKKLGMEWISPELRENRGEIRAAVNRKLPKLVEAKDIKGDLQIQTNWTDGENSIEEMAERARELNYEYIVITDHTKSLAMTGGLDEKKLLKQIKEIEKINSKLGSQLRRGGTKFKILSGAEVNILKDGSLDISNEVLKKLDFVGAAIHSNFHLAKKEQTKRLARAMENPNVDIIFHPTGRIINKRPEVELDLEEIFKTAKKTNTILEINAFPERLDLKDDYVIRAKEIGVKFAVNTDAHSTRHLDFMKFGVNQACRGWCEKKDIINTLPLKDFLALIKKPKKERF